jgi:hypothetical protein
MLQNDWALGSLPSSKSCGITLSWAGLGLNPDFVNW